MQNEKTTTLRSRLLLFAFYLFNFHFHHPVSPVKFSYANLWLDMRAGRMPQSSATIFQLIKSKNQSEERYGRK
jgi:hypothetical protein